MFSPVTEGDSSTPAGVASLEVEAVVVVSDVDKVVSTVVGGVVTGVVTGVVAGVVGRVGSVGSTRSFSQIYFFLNRTFVIVVFSVPPPHGSTVLSLVYVVGFILTPVDVGLKKKRK